MRCCCNTTVHHGRMLGVLYSGTGNPCSWVGCKTGQTGFGRNEFGTLVVGGVCWCWFVVVVVVGLWWFVGYVVVVVVSRRM